MPLDSTLFYQSLGTILYLVIPAWWVEGFATQWTTPFLMTMSWLILAVSLGAYWSMWKLLEKQEATRVASLFYLSPPVTMLMAWVAFGDSLLFSDILGLLIAGCGVLLVYKTGSAQSSM
jgi:drug/metabolite transporter (DMT)-like permease